MALHINIEDLLSARTVESNRIEFKEGWNPDAIYRSVCAFANDLDNTGGGYILIGVTENHASKTAIRPVTGLKPNEIGKIQKDMIGFNNLVKPYYAPRLFVEDIDNRQIIVLWVVAGSERPYEVPETITARHKTWKPFIRRYASSIEAKGGDKEELISLSNNIPFDDRANTQASVASISMLLVQDHLRKIESKLALDVGKLSNVEVLQQMALLSGPKEYLFPRNAALMLFAEKPHLFFPYTWVEIVHFHKGASDKDFTEKKIEGPVQSQITDTLNWLKNNILQEKVTKISGQAEAVRTWNYPYIALEETIANCLFHRNYQDREPVKIRIEPSGIILYNSGGPDRSIKREDFATGKTIPKRYRNRRLGDFFKELRLTEGHATGLPALKKAMQRNGSPNPVFDFDEERTWFQVMLPIHPDFVKNQPLHIDLSGVIWNIRGIDNLLNEILKKTGFPQTRGLAGGIAGNQTIDIADDIVEYNKIIDLLIVNAITNIPDDIAIDIAGGIAIGIKKEQISLLNFCLKPMFRIEMFNSINLANHPTNFKQYIQPLVAINWLTMTIPHKPTSPKQQYLTTLKGRLILEFLKYKTIKPHDAIVR